MSAHPWHGIEPFEKSLDIVNVIVEIPRGGKVKYELDNDSGLLRMDRVLFSAVHYPANYGFIPRTLAEDEDALDILVLCQEPVMPLALMAARPLGVMTMIDNHKLDHKIIALAADDVEYRGFNDLESLPGHRLELVRRFFLDYKILENKQVEVDEFAGLQQAHDVILSAIERYRDRFGPGEAPAAAKKIDTDPAATS